MNVRFVPIDKWPGQEKSPGQRKSAPFRAPQGRRLQLIERELDHLGARQIVVQAYFRADQVRNDGWPYSNARPSGPGVIISFRSRHGDDLSFPCDTYTDWQDNMYAIGLALEALRAVDRYGVTRRAEQYAGWRRIEAPGQEQKPDIHWAIGHLAALAETDVDALRRDPHAIDLAYRAAARKTHPDSGGNTQAFQTLQDAMRIIRGGVQ